MTLWNWQSPSSTERARAPEISCVVTSSRTDRQSRAAAPFSKTFHRTFEVHIRLAGRGNLTLGETTLACTPGDVVLIPAWERHAFHAESLSGRYLVIQFLSEFLGNRTIGGIPWLSFFAMPAANRPRIAKAMRDRVLVVAEGLRHEVEEFPFGWEDGVRAELLKLLLLLVRSSPFEQTPASDLGRRQVALARLMPAVTLVYSDLATRHSSVEAASACRLSVRQFSSEFKRVMGVAFAEFSMRTRLRRAAELLSLTDLSVETIASRAGFADHSHLTRAFARRYNATPTDYRRSLGGR